MEEVMMESAAGADLLMECDEEELEVWPQAPERDKDEEEEHDEALEAARGPMEEEETDPQPVRIIPIPVQPDSSSSKHDQTLQRPDAPLGFKVNGRLIPLLPGGGGAELKLRSHPGGSASGFTSVHIPVTVTVHSPAGTVHINTTASLTATLTTPPPPPGPEADPTPIITGVVSGEAAQRVLNNHSVNVTPGLQTPPSASVPSRASSMTALSPQTTPPASHGTTKASPSSRPAAPHKLLHKGQRGPVPPPNCLVCMSQYKLVMELRGFMCLCSPAIAWSLRNVKRKNNQPRRSRDKKKSFRLSKEPQSSKVSKTRPAASKVVSPIQRTHKPSDDFLSNISPGPPSTTCSPQQDRREPPPDLHGKLVIMVEDFYYGSAPGNNFIRPNMAARKFTGPYRCIHCPKTLRNNVRLMSHMQQHASTMSQQDGHMDAGSSCPHCFRPFLSPFKLQCHLEAVHSRYESSAKCKICELEFGSEPAFLWHMKSTHKPGEMPYVCQVCDFRSSFYSDVWSHFQQLHADTDHLLCQYCLRVLRSSSCYQQHFARHQKKHVFSCDKCRLHFLYVKERIEHKLLHHRTHIRPPQLSGLKPGTKVTVRTYSVVGGSENEDKLKTAAPCKVVDVDEAPPTQAAPRQRQVERLAPLVFSLSQESVAAGVSRPSQHCVECLSSFQDFRSHFPSLVRCSLCRFATCCSTAYANHMINNHASCSKKPQYFSIFQSESRLSHRLSCVSCKFSTCRGDVMANHLTERPEHHCAQLTHTDQMVSPVSLPNLSDAEKTKKQPADNSSSVTSPPGHGGGAFIPIHLLPSGQTSTQLSVKALTSPAPLSSPPAMTIRFLGPRPQPEQSPASPLSASQLLAVLTSLCHGFPQASRRFRTPPQTIRSWMDRHERQLSDRKWCWRTEELAEWVLCQREQQLSVSEDVLLQTARRVLGKDSQLIDCYSWTVDFLLRHELGMQPAVADNRKHHRGRLPRSVRDNSRAFINLLSTQILVKKVPPHRVASMDEFSIFLDWERFSKQNPEAFRLSGSSEETPVFDVVLSALSDGTFLPPLLFFRGTSSHVPEGFPDNVLVEARQDGFSERDHHKIWIQKVWRPRMASKCNKRSVLVVDIHRGHLTDEFMGTLTSMSTEVVYVPSGCCCRLQPLDVCVTPVLRDFLQARWTQLVSQGGLDGLGLDQLALTLACWLSEVSSTLNSETIFLRRSFASACNLKEVEDRREVLKMIRALRETLIQPLDPSDPPPDPEPELELLLVMEEGQDKDQDKQQSKQQEEKDKEKDKQQEEEQKEEKDKEKDKQQEEQKDKEQEEEEAEEVELVKSPSALRLVFDGDSDQDSFHGFQD